MDLERYSHSSDKPAPSILVPPLTSGAEAAPGSIKPQQSASAPRGPESELPGTDAVVHQNAGLENAESPRRAATPDAAVAARLPDDAFTSVGLETTSQAQPEPFLNDTSQADEHGQQQQPEAVRQLAEIQGDKVQRQLGVSLQSDPANDADLASPGLKEGDKGFKPVMQILQ